MEWGRVGREVQHRGHGCLNYRLTRRGSNWPPPYLWEKRMRDDIREMVMRVIPEHEITPEIESAFEVFLYAKASLDCPKLHPVEVAMVLTMVSAGKVNFAMIDKAESDRKAEAEAATAKADTQAKADAKADESLKESAEGGKAVKNPEVPESAQWDGVERGTAVLVEFEGDIRDGEFMSAGSGKDAGKVRIKIDGDNKRYREVPESDVSLKG